MKKIFGIFGAIITTAISQNATAAVYPSYQMPGQYNAAAATPTRITGALPRVGTNQTNAGRQYYMPSDYDRLADSGLYIGLSAAYGMSVGGSISADYSGEQDAYFAPGSFQASDIRSDTVIPFSISLGAAINNDVRADFSYSRYSGMSYASAVETSDGAGGFVPAVATGGEINSSLTMLNVYYNIDSYTGNFGGSLRPYIGAGIGISTNTISDYVVYDNGFYEIVPQGEPSVAGELTMISDIFAYHSGGTSEQLTYMFEGGVTTELEGGIKIDFFVKYANLGKVQSSGSVVVNQTAWFGTGYGYIGEEGAEESAPDVPQHFTNWKESGKLSSVDLGVRLRLQF